MARDLSPEIGWVRGPGVVCLSPKRILVLSFLVFPVAPCLVLTPKGAPSMSRSFGQLSCLFCEFILSMVSMLFNVFLLCLLGFVLGWVSIVVDLFCAWSFEKRGLLDGFRGTRRG